MLVLGSVVQLLVNISGTQAATLNTKNLRAPQGSQTSRRLAIRHVSSYAKVHENQGGGGKLFCWKIVIKDSKEPVKKGSKEWKAGIARIFFEEAMMNDEALITLINLNKLGSTRDHLESRVPKGFARHLCSCSLLFLLTQKISGDTTLIFWSLWTNCFCYLGGVNRIQVHYPMINTRVFRGKHESFHDGFWQHWNRGTFGYSLYWFILASKGKDCVLESCSASHGETWATSHGKFKTFHPVSSSKMR